MSRSVLRRTNLLAPLVLAVLAGCQDATAPRPVLRPQFAQGDGGVWTVNSLADPGDGTCDATECTLREAIAAATSGGTVVFATGLQGDIQLTDGQLTISKDLTIDGGGLIAVDAQGNSRVIGLAGGLPDNPKIITLTGLTFRNGLDGFGAGVALGFGTAVTIRNSIISGNTSTDVGGGIYVQLGSSLILVGSSVRQNVASTDGGGIYNFGTLTVDESEISDNTTAAGDGGGIFIVSAGSADVRRSTLSGNEAYDDGGGVYSQGTVQLRSTTMTLNLGDDGGALGVEGGTATVTNSIIAGNELDSGECSLIGSDPGSIVSGGYNLTTTEGCAFGSTGDVQVTLAQLFTEVLEQELKDNGGPTKTHALIARGRAVDAGYCPGETEDQRGFPRPVDDPVMPNAVDACDIGAYELQGPVAAVADLMVSQTVDKTSVKQGDKLTYFVRVRNFGPDLAPNVVMTDLLSSGVTFLSAHANTGALQAPPAGETGTVTWSVGDLANGGNEVAEIAVTVLVRGKTTITNTASVTGDVADPNEANNSASIKVSVAAGGGKPKK